MLGLGWLMLALTLDGACHSPDQCLFQVVASVLRCLFGC
jgi:hypothetical protein